MNKWFIFLPAVALACSGGGSPTGPDELPIQAGTYFVNATTVTNTCGSGLDQVFLDEIDDHEIQIRRNGSNYSIGFDVFIPATVNGDNLTATQTFTVTGGTAILTFNWTFSENRESFDGTIDVDIQLEGGGACSLSFLTHGERL